MNGVASSMGDLSVGRHTRGAVEPDRRFRKGHLGLDIGRETLSILPGRLVVIGFGSVASSLVAVLVDVYRVRGSEHGAHIPPVKHDYSDNQYKCKQTFKNFSCVFAKYSWVCSLRCSTGLGT
jgi:hypothetical protein